MSDKMLQLPPISDLELATILAALREYANAEAPRTEHFDGIEEAENGVDAPFVDDLAERLNCGIDEIDDDESEGDKYSVLMLYPEYMTENFGDESYLAHVVAASVEDAMRMAQEEAYAAGASRWELEDPQGDPDDFMVLLCVKGHVNDLSNAPSEMEAPGQ